MKTPWQKYSGVPCSCSSALVRTHSICQNQRVDQFANWTPQSCRTENYMSPNRPCSRRMNSLIIISSLSGWQKRCVSFCGKGPGVSFSKVPKLFGCIISFVSSQRKRLEGRIAFRARKVFGTFGKRAPVSRKPRELFGPQKPVLKLQSACFEELVF